VRASVQRHIRIRPQRIRAGALSELPDRLEIRGLRVAFGGVLALNDVSFGVSVGEVCGLIGPNGAGKSTLFKCITRRQQPTNGEIRYGDIDLLRQPVHRIAELGILQTFQEVGLFPSMTVIENVMMGAYHRVPSGAWRGVLAGWSVRDSEENTKNEAIQLLSDHGLEEMANLPAKDISYGSQKLVEVCRALMGHPRFLLLDEPGAGLTAIQRDGLGELVRSLRERNLGVVLVEHNMSLVMSSCDRIIALDSGRLVADGTPAEIRDNVQIQETYLGKSRR
jgi:branched-chain amino acid transport system ATP-binding protein